MTDAGAGYIFAQPDGRPLHPITVTRRYKALIAEAGVPDARSHDARRASATLELESGESIKDVSQRLGHSSAALTMDLYMHPGEERQRENAGRRAAFLKAAGERRYRTSVHKSSTSAGWASKDPRDHAGLLR